MIKSIDKFWVDENNNRWSKNRYTKEEAERMSGTMIVCTGCTDCKDCRFCKECINCINCINCKGCISCQNCEDCKDIEGYFDCRHLF